MCVYVSVAVELRDGELLIPSVLPCEKPNLPYPAFPQSVVSECVTPAPYMAQVPIPPKPAGSVTILHTCIYTCTCIHVLVHASYNHSLAHCPILSPAPCAQRMLPSLRHTYIIPFVPSGFWPRLMSRLLSDKSIKQLARDGCNITEDGTCSLVLYSVHCIPLLP